MHIALLQLASFGDCLYATVVARQIKMDYPNARLTWVISNLCASVLDGNTDVDAIHLIHLNQIKEAWTTGWTAACEWAAEEARNGRLDLVVKTQIMPANIHLYNGLIRSTIYRGYSRPVLGPHRPIVAFNYDHRNIVDEFWRVNRLDDFRFVFLFECGPRSGQSPMDIQRAEQIARQIVANAPQVAFILSSASAPQVQTAQIIDGSKLSFVQNAPLVNRCHGLIGCSSGITWLASSTACNFPDTLQILSTSTLPFAYASVAEDFRRYGLNEQKIIEIGDPTDVEICSCLSVWLAQSHGEARKGWHKPLFLHSGHVTEVYFWLRRKLGFPTAIKTIFEFVVRNGIRYLPFKLFVREAPSLARRAIARMFIR